MYSPERKILVFSIPLAFITGWGLGSLRGTPEGRKYSNTSPRGPSLVRKDSVSSGQSVRARLSGGSPADRGESLLEERAERILRGIPFAFLKKAFLERQDLENARVQARYSSPGSEGEIALQDWENTLFESYGRNRGAYVYYTASGEWNFRGGRTFPFQALAHFYSSRDSQEARNGQDLCWFASVHFRVDGKTASEGTSTCMRWTPRREGKAYAVFNNYAKEMTPYFDSFSVPLPGLGAESEGEPEWYDSMTDQWRALSPVRWETIPQGEYLKLDKTLREDGPT